MVHRGSPRINYDAVIAYAERELARQDAALRTQLDAAGAAPALYPKQFAHGSWRGLVTRGAALVRA
jgi:hypothetical protein